MHQIITQSYNQSFSLSVSLLFFLCLLKLLSSHSQSPHDHFFNIKPQHIRTLRLTLMRELLLPPQEAFLVVTDPTSDGDFFDVDEGQGEGFSVGLNFGQDRGDQWKGHGKK